MNDKEKQIKYLELMERLMQQEEKVNHLTDPLKQLQAVKVLVMNNPLMEHITNLINDDDFEIDSVLALLVQVTNEMSEVLGEIPKKDEIPMSRKAQDDVKEKKDDPMTYAHQLKLDKTHPQHYAALTPEPIEIINQWKLNFNLGNVVKYVARYKTSKNRTDLEKAMVYLKNELNAKKMGAAEPIGVHIGTNTGLSSPVNGCVDVNVFGNDFMADLSKDVVLTVLGCCETIPKMNQNVVTKKQGGKENG